MKVLSAQDVAFFEENGYLVVPDAAPPEMLQDVIASIFEFLEMNPDDPDDWYREPLRPGGMVEMYQHQAMWNTRQYPRIYDAFSDLLGTPELWVSFDRVNFKPPSHPNYPAYDHKGFAHWDTDTSKLPSPPLSGRLRLQGLLCLTDTSADMGGFRCAPGFHRALEEWIKMQPADRNPRVPDVNAIPPEYAMRPIPAKAGDLIIWNTLLLHGNGHNVSNRPRFAQFINMFPARDREAMREDRIRRWQERLPAAGEPFPGDPRHKEELHGTTAQLSPLGRKLLGLDLWQ
jgi:hypothetical protein